MTQNTDSACECPLPDWLQSWSCPCCDMGIEQEQCECFDIMRQIGIFRSEHPHAAHTTFSNREDNILDLGVGRKGESQNES